MNPTLFLVSLLVSTPSEGVLPLASLRDSTNDVDDVDGELSADVRRVGASERWRGMSELELTAMPELLGLGSLDVVEPYDVVQQGASTYTRYQQFHAGIAVDGWVVIQSIDDKVHRVRSSLVGNIVPLRDLRIGEQEALQRAQGAFAPKSARVDGVAQSVTRDGRIVWRSVVDLAGQGYAIEVDAVSGRTQMQPTALRLWAKTTAQGRYPTLNGNQETRLNVEAERAGFITTKRMRSPAEVSNNVTVYVDGGDYSTESSWNDVTTTLPSYNDVPRQGVWVTVHAAVQKTRTLMAKVYGIHTPDIIRAVGVTGGGLEYQPLNGGWILVPYTRDSHNNVTAEDVTFDSIAHETGHALLDRIWDFPGYQSIGEERALAESFADIIAVAAEDYAEGDFNWLLGEDRMPPARTMDEPSLLPNDDNIPGSEVIGDAAWDLAWNPPAPLPLNFHAAAGPSNRFFAMLVDGDSAADVVGVGFPLAMDVFADVLKLWLTPGMDYAAAREAYVDVAVERCGADSQLAHDVENAWRAVNNGPGHGASAAVRPRDNSTNIRPWPTTFRFPIDERETGWTIEIDTSDSFNSPDLRYIEAEAMNSAEAAAIANLRPATLYYWRVRKLGIADADDDHCLSPVRTFTTHAQVPLSRFPLEGAEPAWDVNLAWLAVRGAEKYTVDLYDRPLDLEYHLEASPADCSASQCTKTTAVAFSTSPAVGSLITWGATAYGPTDLYDPNESARGDGRFSATKPVLEILSPQDGEDVSPWKIPVVVTDVGQAETISLGFEDLLTGYSYGGPEIDTDEDAVLLSVPAHFDEDDAQFEVRVRAIGPTLEPVGEDPFWQDVVGEPIVLNNKGSRTIPCMRAPWDNCGPQEDIPVITAGDPVTVEWDLVPEADEYRVRLYPIGPNATIDYDDVREERIHPSNDSTAFFFNGFIPRIKTNVYGWAISVEALDHQIEEASPRTDGPIPGSGYREDGDGLFIFRIPPIEIDTSLIDQRNGKVYLNGNDQIVVRFDGVDYIYAPDEMFLTLNRDSDCELVEDIAIVSQQPAFTTIDFTLSSLIYGNTYSAGLLALSFDSQVESVIACFPFTVASLEEHECGDGVQQAHEGCDDGNTENGDTCGSDCQLPPLPCGTYVSHSGGINGYDGPTFDVGAGRTARLLWNSLVIPDGIHLRQGPNTLVDVPCGSTISQWGGTYAEDFTLSTSNGDNVTVTVATNCGHANQLATEWAFQIVCEDQWDFDPGVVDGLEP